MMQYLSLLVRQDVLMLHSGSAGCILANVMPPSYLRADQSHGSPGFPSSRLWLPLGISKDLSLPSFQILLSLLLSFPYVMCVGGKQWGAHAPPQISVPTMGYGVQPG